MDFKKSQFKKLRHVKYQKNNMQDPFTYFKSLFKKSETSTAANPFIHELITRSEEEKVDFEFWKTTLVARRLLDWLSDQYAIYRVAPERIDEAMNFLNTPSSKGFAIQFHHTKYSKRDVTHLFDWLKEKVQNLNYRSDISDTRTYKKGKWLETTNRHYLKPRTDFMTKEKFKQGYGNITIEFVLRDDQVHHLKLIATRYSDRLYEDAADFKELMQVILK